MRTYKGSKTFRYIWQLGRWKIVLTVPYRRFDLPGISIRKYTNWGAPIKEYCNGYCIRTSRWTLIFNNTRWRPTFWSYLTTWEKVCHRLHGILNQLHPHNSNNRYLVHIHDYFADKWIPRYMEWGKLRRYNE